MILAKSSRHLHLTGLLSIASSNFLVAITQREQVAHIFGKPIYVITDVAILPLSSQSEASRAVQTAIAAQNATETSTTDTDADVSDSEAPRNRDKEHPEPQTPHEPSSLPKSSSNPTTIARDVIANRGQYGRFATQWFLKQGWGGGKSADSASSSQQEAADQPASASNDIAVSTNKAVSHSQQQVQQGEKAAEAKQVLADSSVTETIPNILRRSRMLLTSGSYFFSYEFDLTRRLGLLDGKPEAPSRSTLDPLVSYKSIPTFLAD
jgi:hypothetical protein